MGSQNKTSSVMNGSLMNIVSILVLLSISVFILVVGRPLIQPLISAIIIWYIMVRLAEFIQQPYSKMPVLPYGLALLLSIVLTVLLIYWFFLMLGHSINNIVAEAGAYQRILQESLDKLNDWTGGKLNTENLLTYINVRSLFSNMAFMLSNLAANLALIFIYLLFLFLETHTFPAKLKALCSTKARYRKLTMTMDRINHDITKYLKIKTAASVMTGFCSYLVLLAFQVNYAEFWGLLIFLLNYIPTIGSIIAIVVALLAAAVQAPEIITFVLLAIMLISIQMVIGNFIEPKYMGSYLNLSPMVILLALAFWGKIWGVLGMLLCVPLMVILNIILANFKKTRPLAILLSARGNID